MALVHYHRIQTDTERRAGIGLGGCSKNDKVKRPSYLGRDVDLTNGLSMTNGRKPIAAERERYTYNGLKNKFSISAPAMGTTGIDTAGIDCLMAGWAVDGTKLLMARNGTRHGCTISVEK